MDSGLLWHVNPGRDSDPGEGEKKAQAKTTSEGGWQGPTPGGSGVCQCTNSVSVFA